MNNFLKSIKIFINDKKYFLYVISLIIYINITLIDTTTTFIVERISIYKSLIKYLCLAVIVVKILFCDIKKYSKNTYLRIFILGLIFTLTTIFSTNRAVIQYFVIILGAYDLEFKKIVKYVLIGEGICVLLIIILALCKVIPNRIFGRSNSKVNRYSLGFQYATYPSLFIWYLTMLYIYSRDKNIKIYEYISIGIINIIMYLVTNSRNELLFSIFIIFISIIYNKFQMLKAKKIFNKCAKYSVIFFTLFSILLMNLYNPQSNTWRKIDSFVSGRLRHLYTTKQDYDIKLFGNKMEWIGLSMIYEGKNKESEFFYVDNSYINILYNYGIIVLILVNYGYYYLIKKEEKKENTDNLLIAILFLIIMHSFIDPQLVKIAYNIFILLFVKVIVDDNQIKFKLKRKKEINELGV